MSSWRGRLQLLIALASWMIQRLCGSYELAIRTAIAIPMLARRTRAQALIAVARTPAKQAAYTALRRLLDEAAMRIETASARLGTPAVPP
jgi:hypothetical protein